MRTGLIAKGLAGAALVASTLAAQQTQPRPGPGSGVVTVEGTVDIRRMPAVAVTAAQQGEWRMAVSNTPTFVVSPVPFVRAGGRYQIIWSTGEREIVRVAQPEPGGWVKIVDSPDRWINLTTARSVAAVP